MADINFRVAVRVRFRPWAPEFIAWLWREGRICMAERRAWARPVIALALTGWWLSFVIREMHSRICRPSPHRSTVYVPSRGIPTGRLVLRVVGLSDDVR